MNRNDKRQEFRQLLNRLDEKYVGQVYKALRYQVNSFVTDTRNYGIDYAARQLSTDLFNEKIAPVIQRIYVQAGVLMANKTLSSLNREKKIVHKFRTFGFNEEWTREILNYFRLHLLEKAVLPISQTTRDNILRVLEKGIAEGWTVEMMLKEIQDTQMLRVRALRIIRTETVRAANYGILISEQKYDYETEKEWLSVHDNRTRHSHVRVDAQKRDIDDKFSNGLMFPGDPEGPPEETINCRCRMVIVAKRDRKGNLILKQRSLLNVA